MNDNSKKTIWIDLDNSPHVPFFKPIIDDLKTKEYHVLITARDCFQVCGLADLMGIKYKAVGKHYGKNIIMKVLGTLYRVMQLLPVVVKEKPAAAVSHGSRSQHILSKLLGIKNIIILDYEHAASAGPPPTLVMFPEIISRSGWNPKKSKCEIATYPGIKEDVYVPNFQPDFSILDKLGLEDKDIIVTVRPPASEAHYRNQESEVLFAATMDKLSGNSDVKVILLPRNERQEEKIRKEWTSLFSEGRVIIPKEVVDGLNLIWNSDLVISGGGTMNREAAALGVPVYSIFRGKAAAVDKYLSDQKRLVLLNCVDDVQSKLKIERRNKTRKAFFPERPALQKIVESIEKLAHQSSK